MRKYLIAGVLLSLSAFLAHAGRVIPEVASVGSLTSFSREQARIGRQDVPVARGVRIYNARNALIVPSRVPQEAEVRYELNDKGELKTLWLLSEEEIAELKAK